MSHIRSQLYTHSYIEALWINSSTVAVGCLWRNVKFILVWCMFKQIRGKSSVSVSFLFINNALFSWLETKTYASLTEVSGLDTKDGSFVCDSVTFNGSNVSCQWFVWFIYCFHCKTYNSSCLVPYKHLNFICSNKSICVKLLGAQKICPAFICTR